MQDPDGCPACPLGFFLEFLLHNLLFLLWISFDLFSFYFLETRTGQTSYVSVPFDEDDFEAGLIFSFVSPIDGSD